MTIEKEVFKAIQEAGDLDVTVYGSWGDREVCWNSPNLGDKVEDCLMCIAEDLVYFGDHGGEVHFNWDEGDSVITVETVQREEASTERALTIPVPAECVDTKIIQIISNL